ncbi:hypothetical protein KBI23_16055 [bacterium]|nr:hypothetical protein [bacterium]MBP9810912.1 hypothetical protein [bacterium]
MSDCRSGSCSDRQVVPRSQVWQHEIPMASTCSGGSCPPRIETMQSLQITPAPYGRSCDGGSCRPIETRAAILQFFDKTQHESNIKNNFEFTDKDYSKALAKAAREGKPLVVVFASDRTPGVMYAGDSVKSAQNSTVGYEGWPVKGNAVFVYVDSDRAANNPDLRDLMNQKAISGDRARTIVYNAEIGTDGKLKAVPTALNNDRSGFDGAQLAADIHSAKAYSRPLNVPEVSAERTVAPKETNLTMEERLEKKAQQLEQMKKEFEVLKAEMDMVRRNQDKRNAPNPEAKDGKAPAAPNGPKGIDLLKPDAKPKEVYQPSQFENQRNQIRAAFNSFSESADRRLSGAVATLKDDHPTATAEKTKWLRQQEDMNLLADNDIRNKLNNLGTYWTGSGRRADEDALVEKRAQQWQDLRYQAANPGDPNHKAKQFMLYEFMTGKHTDGLNFGTENEYRVGNGGSALKTDREEWQKQAAKALVDVIKKPGVEHELATRLIIDGLNNPKVPVSVRIELLAGIEHMAADTKNKYLDGHPAPTAVAVVVRSLLKSHNEKEDNGDFQRAAMDKLVKMNAEAAYGVIEYLAREGGSDRTRQHARDLVSKVATKSGK